MSGNTQRIDIEKPLWDLNTFTGRLYHYAWVTDPRSCLVSEEALDEAKILVEKYKKHQEPPGTTLEQVIYAKKLYESAFHPDTGEKQNVFGRMSFQVPGGMAVTGAMLQFYRTNTAVVFWQWVNQSFNALVNYTNRNANSPLSTTQLGVAYASATGAAMITAIGFKRAFAKTNPIFQRFVPFAAVAAANWVNIPLMRQTEITKGVDLMDSNNNSVNCKSKVAAAKGISQVVVSRIVMCAPGMLVLPLIMERLEKFQAFRRIHVLHMPIQVLLVGGFLTFMVPIACAIFPQNCAIATSTIQRFEPEEYAALQKTFKDKPVPEYLFFNKGL